MPTRERGRSRISPVTAMAWGAPSSPRARDRRSRSRTVSGDVPLVTTERLSVGSAGAKRTSTAVGRSSMVAARQAARWPGAGVRVSSQRRPPMDERRPDGGVDLLGGGAGVDVEGHRRIDAVAVSGVGSRAGRRAWR